MSRQQFITKYNWFLAIKNMLKKKSIFYSKILSFKFDISKYHEYKLLSI